jgi:transcriptional regulator with XRE-family HTH domain
MAKHSNALKGVGERIRLARERRGLTQQALGKMLGVSFQMVQIYEHGAKLSLERVYDIASCLGIEADWLLTGERDYPDDELLTITPGHLGFYGRSTNATFFDADTQTKAILGMPSDAPNQLAWQDWYDRIHSDDRAQVDAQYPRLNNPRDGICDVRYRLLGADGVERCIIDHARMIFDGKRQPVRLRGVLLDITSQPRIQKTEDKIQRIRMNARRHW